MAKALYRKYRPKKLSEVVGQEQVTRALENSLKQNKISHAYLFIGPRGTGKTSVARIFAHEVNGFKYEIEDDYVILCPLEPKDGKPLPITIKIPFVKDDIIKIETNQVINVVGEINDVTEYIIFPLIRQMICFHSYTM